MSMRFRTAVLAFCCVLFAPMVHAADIWIAGDSTVCVYRSWPRGGWGQMLKGFCVPGVTVHDEAVRGYTLKRFRDSGRLAKVFESMKTNDFFLIQFGHNDEKEKGPEAGAANGYRSRLVAYIDETRVRGGIPILVTPLERRRFEKGHAVPTHGDYPAVMIAVGKEKNVPVLDLNARSRAFYEALGEEQSKALFMIFPTNSFPKQTANDVNDNTHQNLYGAHEDARMVVEEIKLRAPALATLLRPDIPPFDPAHPDPDTFVTPRLNKTKK